MKKPEKQKNKQVSFKWLSCVPVAQDSWSDHFSGEQETWAQSHLQTEVAEPSFFHSRAHHLSLGHLYPARRKKKGE